jgi:hypothetical protein
LINQHGVAMSKCGPANVLSADPDIVALIEQGSDCQRLGQSPIDFVAFFQLFQSGLHKRFLEVRMQILKESKVVSFLGEYFF